MLQYNDKRVKLLICSLKLLQQYFSANEQYFSPTTNQYKHRHKAKLASGLLRFCSAHRLSASCHAWVMSRWRAWTSSRALVHSCMPHCRPHSPLASPSMHVISIDPAPAVCPHQRRIITHSMWLYCTTSSTSRNNISVVKYSFHLKQNIEFSRSKRCKQKIEMLRSWVIFHRVVFIRT